MYIIYHLQIDFLKLYMPAVSFVFRFHFKVCLLSQPSGKWKDFSYKNPFKCFPSNWNSCVLIIILTLGLKVLFDAKVSQ